MSQFSEDMHAECEKEVQELQDLLEEFEKSDRQKTNEINVLVKENRLLIEQRDAWKKEAEHQYGLMRIRAFGSIEGDNYPTLGALDAYAAGKYPCLKGDI